MGSNSNSGYDLSSATFSPDGRIYQLEYANKAVNNSHTCVAIRGSDGVVFGVEKAVPSALYEDYSNQRIATVADKIGFVFSGLYPDGRALHHYAVEEAIAYNKSYRCDIPCEHLAERLALYVHAYTLYGALRPFGCSVFLGSWSPLKGPELYLVEPCGSMFGYKSWAIGRSHQAAKAEVDEMNSTTKPVSELINEAARIIYSIRDEARDKHCIMELSWVSQATGGKHELVPENIFKEAEEFAKRALEESDDDDDDTAISDLITDVNKRLGCTDREKSSLISEQKQVLFDLDKLLKESVALSNKVREKRLELENVRSMRRMYESRKQSYCEQFEKSTLKLRDADGVDISKSNIDKLRQPNCSEERKAEIQCVLSELDNHYRQLLVYQQLLSEQEKSIEQENRTVAQVIRFRRMIDAEKQLNSSFDEKCLMLSNELAKRRQYEFTHIDPDNAQALMVIQGSDGVVSGTQTIAKRIGLVFSGLYTDGQALHLYAVKEAISYYDYYYSDIPCRHPAEGLVNFIHEPFDLGFSLGTWSPVTGPEIYVVWVNGNNYPPHSAELSIMNRARMPVNDTHCFMELSWVSEHTGGVHEFVPEDDFMVAEAVGRRSPEIYNFDHSEYDMRHFQKCYYA
ncbi:Proteasome subunit alpha type-3 [Trichinella pseudospiralis]|uniref:Proteasome subunit alpha type-3 n=1 Tax=Trichinella pseudospiralis TaxID=6337 RepID=A0A0V1FBT0_TRIPS|nr:Proteasome subunit alpha type-3 [Trichinella pseudospiralis]